MASRDLPQNWSTQKDNIITIVQIYFFQKINRNFLFELIKFQNS